MVTKLLDKLTKEKNMSFPMDFCKLMSEIQSDIYQFAFYQIDVKGRSFVFNNFLGATGELNTDLYEWHKFLSSGDEYLTFGNGVYGEKFMIKTTEPDVGKIYVTFDDEEDTTKLLIANTFTEFIRKLSPEN